MRPNARVINAHRRIGKVEKKIDSIVLERVKEELRDFLDFLRDRLPPDQFRALLEEYHARQQSDGD